MEKNSVVLHKLTLDLQWINQEKTFFVYIYLAEYITFVFFTSEVHIKSIPLQHAIEKIMKYMNDQACHFHFPITKMFRYRNITIR